MIPRRLLRAAQVSHHASTESFLQLQTRTTIYTPPVFRSQAVRTFKSSSVPRAEAEATAKQDATKTDSTTAAAQDGGKGNAANAELDKAKEELKKSQAEVAEFKDKMLRSIADFRNLQAQTKREVTAAREFAIQKFARDLLDSVDNLDRALSTVPAEKLDGSSEANADLKSLHGGLKMTETILLDTLKKHGLERFDPSEKGDRFDPNRHEATFQVPQPDKEDGTVFHTQSKGFSLNGRVLRAAKVGVVKNS